MLQPASVPYPRIKWVKNITNKHGKRTSFHRPGINDRLQIRFRQIKLSSVDGYVRAEAYINRAFRSLLRSENPKTLCELQIAASQKAPEHTMAVAIRSLELKLGSPLKDRDPEKVVCNLLSVHAYSKGGGGDTGMGSGFGPFEIYEALEKIGFDSSQISLGMKSAYKKIGNLNPARIASDFSYNEVPVDNATAIFYYMGLGKEEIVRRLTTFKHYSGKESQIRETLGKLSS